MDPTASHGNHTCTDRRTPGPAAAAGPVVCPGEPRPLTLVLDGGALPGAPPDATPVVLVADDDHLVLRSLSADLSIEGFTVVTAATPQECAELVVSAQPSLIVLDIELGGTAGLDLFDRIALMAAETPIILVSPGAVDFDAVPALDAGAVDHMTKPVRSRELTARIRAVLRRTSTTSRLPIEPRGGRPPQGSITYGNVSIDPARRLASSNGHLLALSHKEYELLGLLLAAQGRVVTRSDCMHSVWRERTGDGSRTLDTHMKRLRRKLDVVPGATPRIITVRGIGYRITP